MSSQEQTATQEVAAPASGDSNTSPTSNLFPPQEVLNFWFSGEYGNDEVMSSPEFEAKMLPMWFGVELTPEGPRPISPEMSAAIDKRCLKFVDTIRALGRNELVGEEWQTTDGLFAQIILGDQLARNCFRGSAEAYGFAHQTQAAARKIFDSGAYKQWRALPYFTFLSCVNLHSEDVADHVKNKAIIEFVKENVDSGAGYERLQSAVVEHSEVVERFGRYPHRNAQLGRESTAEEKAWLADVDNLPSWAKSQLAKSEPSKDKSEDKGDSTNSAPAAQ